MIKPSNSNNLFTNTFNRMFSNCNSLTDVNLNIDFSCMSGTANSQVNAIFVRMFADCQSLSSVNINIKLNNEDDSNFTDVYTNMFNNCSSLQYANVNIDHGHQTKVNGNGNFRTMFENCINLISANLNVDNSYVNTIETSDNGREFNGVFSNCSSLIHADFNVKYNNTPSGAAFPWLFQNCYSLTGGNIQLPVGNSIRVGAYIRSFINCSSLIEPPTFITNSGDISFIGNNAFLELYANCYALSSATLPEFKNNIDTIDYLAFGYTFNNCYNLTNCVSSLPLAKTINYNAYEKTYINCHSLLYSPEFIPLENGEIIQNIGSNVFYETFKGCSSLITAPSFLPIGITNGSSSNPYLYQYIFDGCVNLTHGPLVISGAPSSVYVGGFSRTFVGCPNLTAAVDLIDISESELTTLPNNFFSTMFQNNTQLCIAPEFKLPKYLSGLSNNLFYRTFYNCTSLVSARNIIVENDIQTIGNGAFQETFANCSNLIYVPSSLCYSEQNTVTGINDYAFHKTFENCTSLSSGIKYLVFNGSTKINNIGKYAYMQMYNGCYNLIDTQNYIPVAQNIDTDAYREMFNNCSSLITAPKISQGIGNVNSNAFRSVFANCTNLTGNIDNITFSNEISSIGANAFNLMFFNCSNLIQSPIINLPTGLTTIGNYAFSEMFAQCKSLTEAADIKIINASSNSILSSIGNYAFNLMYNGDTNLTTAHNFDIVSDLPTLNYVGTYAFYRAFYDCTHLTGGLEYLPNAARIKDQCYRETFRNCTSLIQTPQFKHLDIINYIENRGVNSTFNNCTSITSGIELPSAALGKRREYYYLYEKCNSLKYVKVNFTAWGGTNSTEGWFANNTSTSGLFVCPAALPKNRGVNYIPNTWIIQEIVEPITSVKFTALHDGTGTWSSNGINVTFNNTDQYRLHVVNNDVFTAYSNVGTTYESLEYSYPVTITFSNYEVHSSGPGETAWASKLQIWDMDNNQMLYDILTYGSGTITLDSGPSEICIKYDFGENQDFGPI